MESRLKILDSYKEKLETGFQEAYNLRQQQTVWVDKFNQVKKKQTDTK